MCDSLHAAINGELWGNKSTFTASSEGIRLVVKDQHGNYTTIEGATLDGVFRDYADNYTGYRNYRRQMASELEIVNDKAKASYEEWKKTAKGLKSDFDKFYGGGIVDKRRTAYERKVHQAHRLHRERRAVRYQEGVELR